MIGQILKICLTGALICFCIALLYETTEGTEPDIRYIPQTEVLTGKIKCILRDAQGTCQEYGIFKVTEY